MCVCEEGGKVCECVRMVGKVCECEEGGKVCECEEGGKVCECEEVRRCVSVRGRWEGV